MKYFAVKGDELVCGVEYPIREVVEAKNMFNAAEKVVITYAGEPEGELELNMNGLPISETENGEIYIYAVKEISKENFDLWKKLRHELF